MTTETASAAVERAPALEGQTVIVLGGSAGIGLETARSARLEGADVVITGRDPDRLELAAKPLQSLDNALLVPMRLARQLGSRVRPGGSLLFVGGTGGRHTALGLNARRDQLRETLPIGRVVGPEDVAALAVQVMSNTALTGATYDVDGGQQLATSSWG